MLENTEGTIKNRQSREPGNIEYTRRRKTKQKYNTICVGHQYTQANTMNVIKTCTLIKTIGGKDEPNIVLCEIITDITTRNTERKETLLCILIVFVHTSSIIFTHALISKLCISCLKV